MKLIPSIPSEVEHHKYGEREYYMVYLPGVPPLQIERNTDAWTIGVFEGTSCGTALVGEVVVTDPTAVSNG